MMSMLLFNRSPTSPTGRCTETLGLWNNENLIGPRIFYFGSGGVTAHIDIPSAGIEWTEHVSRLVRYRLGSGKFRLSGGTSR